ncbi:MAG: type II toxin-antitoxin system Phd/YefM family antitoxin [Balneolaceae bacterium]
MPLIQLDEDIRSLSDFRANAAAFIERVKSKRRPLILTQHGKSSAVLIDVEDYQKMLNKIQLLEELSSARKELDDGEGISNEELFNELRSHHPKIS